MEHGRSQEGSVMYNPGQIVPRWRPVEGETGAAYMWAAPAPLYSWGLVSACSSPPAWPYRQPKCAQMTPLVLCRADRLDWCSAGQGWVSHWWGSLQSGILGAAEVFWHPEWCWCWGDRDVVHLTAHSVVHSGITSLSLTMPTSLAPSHTRQSLLFSLGWSRPPQPY